MNLIVGVLLGILGSLIVAMFVEWMRKPRLSMSIFPPENGVWYSGGATTPFVALKVLVSNNSLPVAFRWMQRQSARDCRATLRFPREDRTPFIARPMPGRWSGSVQPVPLSGVIGPRRLTIEIYDIARINAESRIHIPAGEAEGLDVAVRFPGGTDAFGWTNESYRHNGHHPDFTLPTGRYLVHIVVQSEGLKKQEFFRIENDHTIKDFRLAPL